MGDIELPKERSTVAPKALAVVRTPDVALQLLAECEGYIHKNPLFEAYALRAFDALDLDAEGISVMSAAVMGLLERGLLAETEDPDSSRRMFLLTAEGRRAARRTWGLLTPAGDRDLGREVPFRVAVVRAGDVVDINRTDIKAKLAAFLAAEAAAG